MSQPPTTSGDTSVTDSPADQRARTRGLQMAVLGAVVAVLGPLIGFLTGSIVGPDREMGDLDAMFVAMFIGLLIGGVGAVVAGLGLLRFVRHHGRIF